MSDCPGQEDEAGCDSYECSGKRMTFVFVGDDPAVIVWRALKIPEYL